MIYSPGPGKYSPGPGQYSPGPELVSWVINSTGRPAGRRPLARQIWHGPGPWCLLQCGSTDSLKHNTLKTKHALSIR